MREHLYSCVVVEGIKHKIFLDIIKVEASFVGKVDTRSCLNLLLT